VARRLKTLAEVRLEPLYEAPGLPDGDLPDVLRRAYGGSLGFAGPRLVANFVATLDGVVALSALPASNRLISAGSEADRLTMGLLRAAADAVLIGSGTLRASRDGGWTPARAYPPAADAFAALRRGRAEAGELVVVTARGSVPAAHPALQAGALVLTTAAAAAPLRRRLPSASTVVDVGDGPLVDMRAAVALLRARGHALILSEAGPRAFGSLLAARLVDELFLTVSPLIAGRTQPGDQLALVEGVGLLPAALEEGRLLSVRRHGGHLFLRYELAGRAGPSPARPARALS
jgi:riboflavin biosynthesis pyrimidine reductase